MDIRALRKEFSKQTGVKSVNPMYKLAENSVHFEIRATDEIVVQFKENVSQQQIDEIHKKFCVDVKKITRLYQLLSVHIKFDPLEVANAYQTSGLVNYCHPNFISYSVTY